MCFTLKIMLYFTAPFDLDNIKKQCAVFIMYRCIDSKTALLLKGKKVKMVPSKTRTWEVLRRDSG